MKIKINKLTRTQWFILAGLLLLLPLFIKRYQKVSLPIYGQLNQFSLTDNLGKPFGTKDLKGNVWVADFIFSKCLGPCLTMSKNMASLHQSFKTIDRIHMVSLTVDPENDSPEVLTEYAKKYNANTDKWHFLTGKRGKLKTLLRDEFRVGFQDNIIFHSVYFVLVDDLLRIRGYYDGTDPKQLKKLIVDLAFQFKRSKKRQKKIQIKNKKKSKN